MITIEYGTDQYIDFCTGEYTRGVLMRKAAKRTRSIIYRVSHNSCFIFHPFRWWIFSAG